MLLPSATLTPIEQRRCIPLLVLYHLQNYLLKHTKADVALVPPPIITELSTKPELLDCVCSSLDMLVYAGGDGPAVVGIPVAKRARLLNVYGSSEEGNLLAIRPEGPFPVDD
jgi:hypothetical protein